MMRNVVVSLGAVCNSRCIFCRDGLPGGKWESREVIAKRIARFSEDGFRHIVFLGGEPTAHPELTAIVRHAKLAGFRVIEVSTNGMRLAEEGFAQGLIKAGVTCFTISIHSHNAGIEDSIMKVPGAWMCKIQALEILMRLKINGTLSEAPRLNPVICSKTLPSLSEYADVYHARGIAHIHFNYIGGSTYMSPQGDELRRSGMVPSYAEAAPRILGVILRHRGGHYPGLRVSFSDVPVCALLRAVEGGYSLGALISSYVADRPSGTHVMVGGHWVNWDRYAVNSFKMRLPQCARCGFRNVCGGVLRNYADAHGVGEFAR